jgi:hypothetical protein
VLKALSPLLIGRWIGWKASKREQCEKKATRWESKEKAVEAIRKRLKAIFCLGQMHLQKKVRDLGKLP